MTKGFPRAPLSLLLVAAMLAWSFSPPLLQHAHEGGSEHHHHADAACAPTADAHLRHHASHREQSRSVPVTPKAIAEETSHLHFEWLGFRLTLPDTESPANQGDDHRCKSKLLFVQASRSSAPLVHSGSRLDASPLVLPLNAMAADMAATGPAVSGSLLPVVSLPLCDRARHERSGVQLS
jgi:hypothetical protein